MQELDGHGRQRHESPQIYVHDDINSHHFLTDTIFPPWTEAELCLPFSSESSSFGNMLNIFLMTTSSSSGLASERTVRRIYRVVGNNMFSREYDGREMPLPLQSFMLLTCRYEYMHLKPTIFRLWLQNE
jgi:hypothetical protein